MTILIQKLCDSPGTYEIIHVLQWELPVENDPWLPVHMTNIIRHAHVSLDSHDY